MIVIKIQTDNAAFQDGNWGSELAAALRRLALSFEDLTEEPTQRPAPVIDSNGNVVGRLFIMPDSHE